LGVNLQEMYSHELDSEKKFYGAQYATLIPIILRRQPVVKILLQLLSDHRLILHTRASILNLRIYINLEEVTYNF
jgi:hypothetical protein